MSRARHPLLQLRKLPPSYGRLVTPLVLSIFMSGIVSAVVTVKGLGLGPGFLTNWLSAWFASCLIAFPSLMLILPIVRRIVSTIVEPSAR
ncbi:DUF2798 domain-containing protein [Bradyrhizobium sp. RT10b]|uniref:DUF2798 domain-containing protein n=1 Tax=Bradyrhizobium sp. RT10b TaxID=3156331 RepID=UPI0033926805